MYGVAMTTPQQFGQQIAVTKVPDLEYLVKESELITGRPGRVFHLRSGTRMLSYQVTFDGRAFRIVGSSLDGLPLNLSLAARELEQSEFGVAMKEYRLFCHALQEDALCRYPTKALTLVQ